MPFCLKDSRYEKVQHCHPSHSLHTHDGTGQASDVQSIAILSNDQQLRHALSNMHGRSLGSFEEESSRRHELLPRGEALRMIMDEYFGADFIES